jgi:hypothetical protein
MRRRDDAHVAANGLVAADALEGAFLQYPQRSLTCICSDMSPISSRNSVPPSANSKRPIRVDSAPVKAPFSWPNSSLSRRSAGIAPQFTGTNGCPARLDSS